MHQFHKENKMKTIMAFICLLLAGPALAQQAASKPPEGAIMNPAKILVVYYSRTGNTRKAAQDIAAKLGADMDEIVDLKNRSGAFGWLGAGRDATLGIHTKIAAMKKDPSAYDIVIIGTPVWSWNISVPVRAYLVNFRDKLPQKVAYFITSGSTKPEKIVKIMEKISGKQAIASAGFLEQEIKDTNTGSYDKKLADFIGLVK
jgi:menaquinone-dependent protoporphyrinogen IX oxidase